MEEKIYDTKDLQLFSLMQAMNTIGYMLYRTNKGGLVFVSNLPINSARSCLSVGKAIHLYNHSTDILYNPLKNMGFDSYFCSQFEAAKVVKKLGIQYSKRKKLVKVNGPEFKNYVRFVHEDYFDLFLGNVDNVPQ